MNFKKFQFAGTPNSSVLAEKGEVFKTPDGDIQQIASHAPSHDDGEQVNQFGIKSTSKGNGGVVVDAESVLSDSLTQVQSGSRKNSMKEQIVKIKAEEGEIIASQLGLDIRLKKAVSPSKLFLEIQEAKDKIALKIMKASEKTQKTRESSNALEANQAQLMSLPTDEEIYEAIFHTQEEKKENSFLDFNDESTSQYGGSTYVQKPISPFAIQKNQKDILEEEYRNRQTQLSPTKKTSPAIQQYYKNEQAKKEANERINNRQNITNAAGMALAPVPVLGEIYNTANTIANGIVDVAQGEYTDAGWSAADLALSKVPFSKFLKNKNTVNNNFTPLNNKPHTFDNSIIDDFYRNFSDTPFTEKNDPYVNKDVFSNPFDEGGDFYNNVNTPRSTSYTTNANWMQGFTIGNEFSSIRNDIKEINEKKEELKKLEAIGIDKKDVDKFEKILASDKSTTGTLSFSADENTPENFKVRDKNVILNNENLDEQIELLSKLKTSLGEHPLSNNINSHLEDLYSTKYLRNDFIEDLKSRGLNPTMNDMSIITGNNKTKYLIDGEGNVLGNITGATAKSPYVGTAKVKQDFHGTNEIGKNNKVAEALYRGVSKGLKETHGKNLQTQGIFAPTSFTDPNTGELVTRRRAEDFWNGLVRKGIAEKLPNGNMQIIKALPPTGLGALYTEYLKSEGDQQKQQYGGDIRSSDKNPSSTWSQLKEKFHNTPISKIGDDAKNLYDIFDKQYPTTSEKLSAISALGEFAPNPYVRIGSAVLNTGIDLMDLGSENNKLDLAGNMLSIARKKRDLPLRIGGRLLSAGMDLVNPSDSTINSQKIKKQFGGSDSLLKQLQLL